MTDCVSLTTEELGVVDPRGMKAVEGLSNVYGTYKEVESNEEKFQAHVRDVQTAATVFNSY